MYYNDHDPPHFHVRYGGDRALIAIDTLTVLEGRIPPRVLGLIVEWGTLHREELLADWTRSRKLELLKKIAPLA